MRPEPSRWVGVEGCVSSHFVFSVSKLGHFSHFDDGPLEIGTYHFQAENTSHVLKWIRSFCCLFRNISFHSGERMLLRSQSASAVSILYLGQISGTLSPPHVRILRVRPKWRCKRWRSRATTCSFVHYVRSGTEEHSLRCGNLLLLK